MCRARSSICVVCEAVYGTVVPCNDRVERSCIVTLFRPTECIKEHVYIFACHSDCLLKYGPDTKMSDLIGKEVKLDPIETVVGIHIYGEARLAAKLDGTIIFSPSEINTSGSAPSRSRLDPVALTRPASPQHPDQNHDGDLLTNLTESDPGAEHHIIPTAGSAYTR